MQRLDTIPAPTRRGVRGFSLIELMVAVTIGLVVMLIIFNVLRESEGRKRTSTSVNDMNQSGAYSTYLLDRAIRSAGSGFTNQRASGRLVGLEGCALSVQRGAQVILPRPTAFPAPFAAITQSPVIAPVIIDADTASDVITVMEGAGGIAELGSQVTPDLTLGDRVGVQFTLPYRVGDIVLFGHAHQPARSCVVSQVSGLLSGGFQVGGTYAANSAPLTNVQNGDVALTLGNLTGSAPQFRMYGVGPNQTLMSYDLLDLDASATATLMAEGVFEMRAIYGLDTSGDNVIDTWQAPTGLWAAAALRDGSTGPGGASERIRQIVAIRIVLVMRSALEERDDIQASTSYVAYSDLPAGSPTLTLSYTGGTTARYRYRFIETTIPIRNSLL